MSPRNHLSDANLVLQGLRLGGVGVWRWKIGSDLLLWTDNLELVHNLQPGSFDGTLASFQRDLHPDDAGRVWQAITLTLDTGAPYKVVYRSAARSGGDPLWIEASGGVVRDDAGDRYLTGVCLDVTSRVQSETELARRLHQQAHIQALSSYALGEAPLADVMKRAVETAAEIFGAPLTKILQFKNLADHLQLVAGVGWREGLVGSGTVGVDRDSQAGYTLISQSPVVVSDLRTESRFSGPALLREHGVRSGMSVVIEGHNSRPLGVFGVHTTELRFFDQHDVDALISLANIVAQSARQHEAIEQKNILLREMAHRAGNLLQVVSSIASQTFRTHSDISIALRSFSDRLESLSRANHLITRGGWANTRFLDLVEEVLGGYSGRVELSGRDIQLPADLSFDLGLVIHELATNSSKYGSLSRDHGSVRFSWHIEAIGDFKRNLVLVWEDSHSAVVRSQGTGFGSKLKRAIIEKKWNGTISITTEGPYRFACSVPLARST